MAQQIINVGNVPNDRQGDPLRVAFEKINNNFTEVYNIALAAGQAAPPDGAVQFRGTTSLTAVGSTFTGVTQSWIAWSADGRYYRSTDGSIWNSWPSPTPNTIRNIATVGTGFVAVGDAGTIITSSDGGSTWTLRTSGVSTNLTAVDWNAATGIYLAVGLSGVTLRSTDAASWTLVQLNPAYSIRALARQVLPSGTTGTPSYVAVGDSGLVLLSPDGVNWLPQVLPGAYVSTNLTGVSHNGTSWVAVGDDGSILSSTDGITWTARTSGVTSDLYAIAWGPIPGAGNANVLSSFMTVGANGISLISTDGNGATWSSIDTGGVNIYSTVGWSAVGEAYITAGSNGSILTSTTANGVTNWSNVGVGSGWDGSANFVYDAANVTLQLIGNANIINVNSNIVTSNYVAANQFVAYARANLGDIGNVVILGGSNTQVLTTDGNGNLYWSNGGGGGGGGSFISNGAANIAALASPVTARITGNLLPSANEIYSLGSATQRWGNAFIAGNVTLTGANVSLGNIANLHIPGGSNGQVLTTDGNGNLYWGVGGGTANAIPAIYWTATTAGNNQQFSNAYLANYNSAAEITLFWNGALLENDFYTLNGNTLTITTPVAVGDSIAVIRTGAGGGGGGGGGTPSGNTGELQYNAGGVFGGTPGLFWDGNSLQFSNNSVISIGGATSNGQILTGNIDGTLSWSNTGAVVAVPAIYWTAPISGNNQQFSNSLLNTYTSASDITLYINGVLLQDTNYTLSGSTLTVNVPLTIDDTITAGRTAAASVSNVTNPYGDSNVLQYLSSGTFAGSILPDGNAQWDLGGPNNYWRTLYVSGSTIFLGQLEISSNVDSLLINGNVVPVINANGNLVVSGTIFANGIDTPFVDIDGVQLTGNEANLLYNGLPLLSTDISGNVIIDNAVIANGLVANGIQISGPAVITGNLAVTGNITYSDVQTLNVEDPIIQLGGGPNGAPLTINDGLDRGVLMHYYTTQPVDAWMGWKNDLSEFQFVSNGVSVNNVISVNQFGNIRASEVYANLQGNVVGTTSNLQITGGLPGQVLTTNGNGNLYWSTVSGGGGNGGISGILVGTLSNANTLINSWANTTGLGFAFGSGFSAEQISNGFVKITSDSINAAFSTITVDGLSPVTAQGKDTVNFVSGNNIQITSNASADPANISFSLIPGGSNTQLQFNNGGSLGGISTVTWDGNNISLGQVSNIKIGGGNSGWGLITDGAGNLQWSEFTANITAIPAIYFTAPATGNNQQFSNTYLASYQSNTEITLFLNGSLLTYDKYTLNGTILTVTIPLTIGDRVDVIQQFAGNVVEITGTPGGSNLSVQYNFNGNFDGESTFTYSPDTNTLNVANLNVTNRVASNLQPSTNGGYDLGGASSRWRELYLTGTGIYLGSELITNANSAVSTANLRATNITATGTFVSSNSNIGAANATSLNTTQISVTGDANFTGNTVFTSSANFTGSANFTSSVNFTGNTNLGSVGNINIGGGSNGQYLQTNGNGVLSWAGLPPMLTVGLLSNSNVLNNTVSNVMTLGFDSDSGFDVTDLGNGVAKIAINSTFKFWEVDGQPGLVAEGLDTVNFIAGNNVTIVANNSATPKSIEFSMKTSALENGNVQASLNSNGQLSVPGNVISNAIQLRVNGQEFSSRQGYAINTFTNIPATQTLISWNDPSIVAMDMVLISTDASTGSRQVSKIAAAIYGSSVNYNETSTIYNNLQIVDWAVAWVPNQIELQATLLYNVSMTHRVEITLYREL